MTDVARNEKGYRVGEGHHNRSPEPVPSAFWRGFAHGVGLAVAGWAVGIVVVCMCWGAC